MGYSKNLMIMMYPDVEDDEEKFDDLSIKSHVNRSFHKTVSMNNDKQKNIVKNFISISNIEEKVKE